MACLIRVFLNNTIKSDNVKFEIGDRFTRGECGIIACCVQNACILSQGILLRPGKWWTDPTRKPLSGHRHRLFAPLFYKLALGTLVWEIWGQVELFLLRFFLPINQALRRLRKLYKDELLQSRTTCGCPSSTICSSRIPTSRIPSAGWLSTTRIPPAISSAAIPARRRWWPNLLRSFPCSFVLLLCAGGMLLTTGTLGLWPAE